MIDFRDTAGGGSDQMDGWMDESTSDSGELEGREGIEMSTGGSGVIIIFVTDRESAGTERQEGRAALGRSQVMDPN